MKNIFRYRTNRPNNNPQTQFGWLFAAVLTLGMLAAASPAKASDPVGVYALVEKVVLQPSEKEPDTIQVWGWFSFASGPRGNDYGAPQKGFLYYKLNPEKPEAARKEWNDLKSLAGTKQVVGFGSRYKETKGTVRKENDKAENPDVYPLGFGLTKMRNASYGPIKALLEAAGKTKGDKS